MHITRIKVKNFKTYLDLDLDLSVEQEKPIILIGGKNGGGKTTMFEAIYGALYGLQIHSAKQFNELLNAGALGKEEKEIILELHFTGKVLNEEQKYVLTRNYILNPSGIPVEGVKLNMGGSIFAYGTASHPAQRAEQEAQVNKIIKANLPQELSRYFLFDAMEAGNLLKEDQLNKVIKENIENVMGFNKYMQMAKASEILFQAYTAQRLKVEKEKNEYMKLVEQKRGLEDTLAIVENQLQDALQYSVANKELYDNLKAGLNQETTIKTKIEQTQTIIDSIYKKERLYRDESEEFVKDFELNICIPKLVESVKNEIILVLKTKQESLEKNNANIQPNQIEIITKIIIDYLKKNNIILDSISESELIDNVISLVKNTNVIDEYDYLEYSEVNALDHLLTIKTINRYPALSQQQKELNHQLCQIPMYEVQIEQMRAQITGRDYALLKAYEENESNIITYQKQINEIKIEISAIEKRLHQYDIQTSQEPDPKYDTLAKLRTFFEDVANKLLLVKKQQIEARMKQDLNINLAAYAGVIDRVELSENLSNLTFKIYHKAGNEVYLNQLNTASKQVVVQVLLKALHEFGDYDPPVMIDTVMGVLDETSRSTVLENYFPELSHQTILLSSDSEIRPENDLMKINAFISKAYTLERNREQQLTVTSPGYFGKTIQGYNI